MCQKAMCMLPIYCTIPYWFFWCFFTPSPLDFEVNFSFPFFFLPNGSGFAGGNVIKVLQGERIGTLFHRDAHKWVPVEHVGVREMAVAARESSRRLQVPITLYIDHLLYFFHNWRRFFACTASVSCVYTFFCLI